MKTYLIMIHETRVAAKYHIWNAAIRFHRLHSDTAFLDGRFQGIPLKFKKCKSGKSNGLRWAYLFMSNLSIHGSSHPWIDLVRHFEEIRWTHGHGIAKKTRHFGMCRNGKFSEKYGLLVNEEKARVLRSKDYFGRTRQCRDAKNDKRCNAESFTGGKRIKLVRKHLAWKWQVQKSVK